MSPSYLTMKLVFDQTGDELPFNDINNEVLELFIDKTFVTNNEYKLVKQCTQDLHTSLSIINDFLISINSEMRFPISVNTLDQSDLNFLHAHWAKYTHGSFSTKKPNLSHLFADDELTCTLYSIANRLPPEHLLKHLDNCNDYVHDIENQFTNKKLFRTKHVTSLVTPQASQYTNNNVANISIARMYVGRGLQNKFRNFDLNLEYNDENNFDEIHTALHINFANPETITYSTEYLDWCKLHNRTPRGNNLNIGNFAGLAENLTTYRTIMYNNTQERNSFSIRK